VQSIYHTTIRQAGNKHKLNPQTPSPRSHELRLSLYHLHVLPLNPSSFFRLRRQLQQGTSPCNKEQTSLQKRPGTGTMRALTQAIVVRAKSLIGSSVAIASVSLLPFTFSIRTTLFDGCPSTSLSDYRLYYTFKQQLQEGRPFCGFTILILRQVRALKKIRPLTPATTARSQCGSLLHASRVIPTFSHSSHLHNLAPVKYWYDGCSQSMRKRWYWWRGF
jgi:hypothetical protein